MMRFGFRGGVRVHICLKRRFAAFSRLGEEGGEGRDRFHRVQRFDPREQR